MYPRLPSGEELRALEDIPPPGRSAELQGGDDLRDHACRQREVDHGDLPVGSRFGDQRPSLSCKEERDVFDRTRVDPRAARRRLGAETVERRAAPEREISRKPAACDPTRRRRPVERRLPQEVRRGGQPASPALLHSADDQPAPCQLLHDQAGECRARLSCPSEVGDRPAPCWFEEEPERDRQTLSMKRVPSSRQRDAGMQCHRTSLPQLFTLDNRCQE